MPFFTCWSQLNASGSDFTSQYAIGSISCLAGDYATARPLQTRRGSVYVAAVDASTTVTRQPARSLHRFANPGRFLRLSGRVLPPLAVAALLLTGAGLV